MIRLALGGAFLLAATPAFCQAQIDACFACHGAAGVSTTPLTPSLAAQPASYVIVQLALFRSGKRTSVVMAPMAQTVAAREARSLAEAIESLAPPPAGPDTDSSRYERGRAVAARERCDSCHQPDYSGIETAPRLAHQREDYLVKALGDFKAGARVGYGEPVMPAVAKGLSNAEIGELAHYLAHFRRRP